MCSIFHSHSRDLKYIPFPFQGSEICVVYSIPIPGTWGMCSIFHSHSRDLGYVKPSDLNSQCVHGESQQAKTVKYYTQCYYEAFVRVHVVGYLGLTNTTFLPPPSLWGSCAPTWNDSTYRHEVMQVGREVHGCHGNYLTIRHLCFPSLSKTLLLPHVHIYTCMHTNKHPHTLSLNGHIYSLQQWPPLRYMSNKPEHIFCTSKILGCSSVIAAPNYKDPLSHDLSLSLSGHSI